MHKETGFYNRVRPAERSRLLDLKGHASIRRQAFIIESDKQKEAGF
jgi:hypothetical protein